MSQIWVIMWVSAGLLLICFLGCPVGFTANSCDGDRCRLSCADATLIQQQPASHSVTNLHTWRILPNVYDSNWQSSSHRPCSGTTAKVRRKTAWEKSQVQVGASVCLAEWSPPTTGTMCHSKCLSEGGEGKCSGVKSNCFQSENDISIL